MVETPTVCVYVAAPHGLHPCWEMQTILITTKLSHALLITTNSKLIPKTAQYEDNKRFKSGFHMFCYLFIHL